MSIAIIKTFTVINWHSRNDDIKKPEIPVYLSFAKAKYNSFGS